LAANTQVKLSYLRRGKIAAVLFSRRMTQFLCPNLSEKFSLLFRREGSDDFFEVRIAAERVPDREQF